MDELGRGEMTEKETVKGHSQRVPALLPVASLSLSSLLPFPISIVTVVLLLSIID